MVSLSLAVKLQAVIRPIRHRSIESVSTLAIFVAAVFILSTTSIVRALTRTSYLSLEEKRVVAAFPASQWTTHDIASFPSKFEKYYSDRFPFRVDLVSFISYMKYECFGVSWLWSVLPGNSGWMYFLDQNGLQTIRHTPLFTRQELQSWSLSLEERRKWLSDRNIRFLFVIAPHKASIYPEYVPDTFKKVSPETRCDQLVKYLKENTQIDFVDLRPDLIAAKKLGPLYFKTDTHWTRLGAFIAYSTITTKLSQYFPAIKPLNFDQLTAIPGVEYEGDLAQLIAVHRFITDRYTEYRPKDGYAWQLSSHPSAGKSRYISRDYIKPFASEMRDSNLPTAYIVRDSFMCYLQPFLSQDFRRAYFDWNPKYGFNTSEIEKEHPNIVIQEMVENQLFDVPPN
jgi:alginate O-acetyltransferase complex protein AlgJ